MSGKGWENADHCSRAWDQAQRLALHDWTEARRIASEISLPWHRAGALASVASHAPSHNALDILKQAAATALTDTDAYRRSGALSFVIETANACGHSSYTRETLQTALRHAQQSTPLTSRGHAFERLLSVAIELGKNDARLVADPLLALVARHARTPWRYYAKTFMNRTAYHLVPAFPTLAAELFAKHLRPDQAAKMMKKHARKR